MQASACRNVVNVKHLATRYLHDALLPYGLDFFIPISSIAGAIGPLTQSIYAAANAAMDSFARHRHAMGLPCVSLALGAISEVGHLHENNEVQDKFRRIGIFPMNRVEFLHALETAVRLQTAPPQNHAGMERALLADKGASSYFLTGLDPLQIGSMVESGYEGGSSLYLDPKFSVWANIIKMKANESSSLVSQTKESVLSAVQRIAHGEGRDAAIAHTTKAFVKKLSNLLLMPIKQFDILKSVVDYGLDSMVGSELRVWVYLEMKVDVSFIELSVSTRSIKAMVELLFDRMKLE